MLCSITLVSQNPHGEALTIQCASCHTSDGWEIDRDTFHFNHDTFDFKLEGEHLMLECTDCHKSLVFEDAPHECIDCHLDIHQTSVGTDCRRCHNAESWLVFQIPELHDESGFPLQGAHAIISCSECHQSESQLRFDPIGTNCIHCHREDYEQTERPDHQKLNFSTNCNECHDPLNGNWDADRVDHEFFPLELGHDIQDCAACHQTGDFSETSAECIDCHGKDFENTINPDHLELGFDQDCRMCHTIDPGWSPADYKDHDEFHFPIYSGAHQGKWSECLDCHTNSDNYSLFSCIVCHLNPETDEKHEGYRSYVYENSACLECHPNGEVGEKFNHEITGFALTGAHDGLECSACHQNGYTGTPSDCYACHSQDYEESRDPDHTELIFPIDCKSCHSTDPGWSPALFEIHEVYYPLVGAHSRIAGECLKCHEQGYDNTPTTCVGCHQDSYDQTNNPVHTAAGFSTNCTECHNVEAWEPTAFDHDFYFPLNGQHQKTDCISCHTTGYKGTATECVDCHLGNYEMTQTPVHLDAGFNTECIFCHDETSWIPSTFDHDSKFALNGAHQNLDCISCHITGYSSTPNQCIDCHREDFEGSDNPDHQLANFSTNCLDCHTEEAWLPSSYNHGDFYALEGAHSSLECIDCHTTIYAGTGSTCIDCHSDDYDNSSNPNHIDLSFSKACDDCHTTDPGWAPARFEFHDDYYPLTGAHESITDCYDCHMGDYFNTPRTCVGCHLADYEGSIDPDHQELSFPQECDDCHTTNPGWSPALFEIHNEYYPLTGAHATGPSCNECHTDGYSNTPRTCVGCHLDDYEGSTNPDHQILDLPKECDDCHTTDPGWSPALFERHDDFYPLTGAHETGPSCNDCHTNGYSNTPKTCVGCHLDDFEGSTNPDHQELNLPKECDDCHTTDPGWTPALFERHDDFYPLTGAHETGPSCNDCHMGNYSGTPKTCAGCHLDDYESSTNPDHQRLSFPKECDDCHTTDQGWAPATLDNHDDFYPLTGAHESVMDCADCHMGDYNSTPNTCVGCHLDDFEASNNPDHQRLNFPNECDDCHTTEPGWAPATLDNHDDFYPLTGAHESVMDCADCHMGDYNSTPNTCVGCHLNDFEGSSNPDHVRLNIPRECDDCHTTEPGWAPAGFDIHDDYYPLTGAHNTIRNQCADCHMGDYNSTPNTCVGCHLNDYSATTNPDHTRLSIPQECDDCHSTQPGWMPATFDIHDDYYPLRGAHNTIRNQCADCHMGDYNSTPNTCVGCHLNDYSATTNPDHSAAGFNTECQDCHDEFGWVPSSYTHDFYPLNGAHSTLDCNSCHSGGYVGTPNTCVGCHLDDYTTTTNPDHSSAMYPTDCLLCHNEDMWVPANFNHDGDYFPIYSGRHDGEWVTCAECHTTPGNFMLFSCIDCHEHSNKAQVDEDHEDEPGYVYESNACYSCHPLGEK